MSIAVIPVWQAGMFASETDIYFLASVIWCWSKSRKLLAVQFIKWRDNSDRLQEGYLETRVMTY